MRAKDWSATPLGPPPNWPDQLKVPLSLVLASKQPMFVVWGRVTQTLLYNDSYALILQGKHPDALGRPLYEVFCEVSDQLTGLITAVFDGDAQYSEDSLFMLDRGRGTEESHFAYSCTPIHDEAEVIVGLFGACIETTASVFERYDADRELGRLTKMFDQAPGFMCLLDGPDHRFVLSNPAHRRLVGDRNVVGKTVAEVLPEAVGQGFIALLDNVYASGKPFRSSDMTWRIETAAGDLVDERLIDFVYQPLTDARGEVTGIFAEGVDITERSEAEAELRTRERELRTALEAGKFGTWTYDIQSNTLSTSPTYRTMFGNDSDHPLTYDEVVARVHPQDTALRQAVIDQSRSSRSDYHVEFRIFTPGGELRWLSVWGQWVCDAEGNPLSLSGLSADITDRKILEQNLERRVEERTAELELAQASLRQSQKMEAVGQLTGGIAHDFNNLLMGIGGSLEMLLTRLGQGRLETLTRYIEAAQTSVARAAALTQRLLAFSRRQTLDPRPVQLDRLIVDMEDLIRRTVGPGIELEVTIGRDLWRTLADTHQVENALLNLCINARDAMPEGGMLTIETTNKTIDPRSAIGWDLPAGDYTCLHVTDTGCGMTPEVVSRAFDPFFTTKPLGQGTGLGLSMIYGFVRQSGGEVRIYSKLDHGTTVCVYLPRFVGETELGKAALTSASLMLEGHGETVLVVDDEATVRMLISEVLQDAGYLTIEVEDGPAGMNVLKSDRRIDLLITDVGLPGGMNGRQVADAGRVLRPHLKVLFVTGYAENAVVRDGRLEDGMQIITKPFSVGMLGDKVRTLIDS